MGRPPSPEKRRDFPEQGGGRVGTREQRELVWRNLGCCSDAPCPGLGSQGCRLQPSGPRALFFPLEPHNRLFGVRQPGVRVGRVASEFLQTPCWGLAVPTHRAGTRPSRPVLLGGLSFPKNHLLLCNLQGFPCCFGYQGTQSHISSPLGFPALWYRYFLSSLLWFLNHVSFPGCPSINITMSLSKLPETVKTALFFIHVVLSCRSPFFLTVMCFVVQPDPNLFILLLTGTWVVSSLGSA